MQKTILICGSFNEPITPEKWKLLNSIIKTLVNNGYIIANANGQYLGQYVTLSVMEACITKGLMSNDHLIQHVPPQRVFVDSLNTDTSFESLAHYHKTMMIGVKHPNIAVFIGGGKGTNLEYNLCKQHNVPYIGLPYFGGTGEDVFNKVSARIHYLPFANHNRENIAAAINEMVDDGKDMLELMVLQTVNHIVAR